MMNSRIRDRQIILLLTILCLTLYFFMKNYVIKSSVQRIKIYKEGIEKIEQDYARNLKKINSLEKKYSEYYYKKSKLDNLNQLAGISDEGEELIDVIINSGIEAGIDFSSIRFSNSLESHKGELSLEFTTDYFRFLEFLKDLKNLSQAVDISRGNINRSSDKINVRLYIDLI